MKRLRKIAACLVVGLMLNAGGRADEAAVTNNPYAAVGSSNVFGLNPPATADVLPPGEPLPKIAPNGIMSIFGQLQVLFKVSRAARPGQPAQENSYILDEHQSQDGIEVLRIDPQTGLITFNNHGVVQKISLPNALVIATPMLVVNEPATDPMVTLPKTYPPEFVLARTPNYLGGGPDAVSDGKPAPHTTLEQRIIMIEAQRAYLKSQNDPAADLLPPTAMTPPDTFAPKGN